MRNEKESGSEGNTYVDIGLNQESDVNDIQRKPE